MGDGDATVTVRVTLPVLEGSGGATDDALVGAELRRLWVIEQVRLHRVGVARGAVLAGVSRAEFMALLGTHGVPVIDYPVDELQRELQALGVG